MSSVATYRLSMTEADMRAAIIEAVRFRGGRVFYIRDSRTAPETADLPDLIILLPDRGVVVFAELKSIRRKLTDGQRGVMDMLAQCRDFESFVVRPEPKDEFETSYTDFVAWLEGER